MPLATKNVAVPKEADASMIVVNRSGLGLWSSARKAEDNVDKTAPDGGQQHLFDQIIEANYDAEIGY